MRPITTWIGFVFGSAALVLQFALTVQLRLAMDGNLLGAVVFYFTFFTILTNLMLVLIYASELWPSQAMSWFRSPVTRGMMAAAITLVCLFYHFILAETWNPQGLALVCDVALHYATPIFYVAWWAVVMRHGTLRYVDVPAMLLPPTIYLIYAMIRGAIVSEYPYPILEADRLGYGAVAINVAIVLVGLTILCAIVVALDRVLPRLNFGGR